MRHKLRDGSEGEIGNGYPLCKAVAADTESKNVIPLYCEAYSHSSPDVKSENSQIFKAIDAIYKHVGDKGIHAIDRGGDRGVIFDKYLNRDKPQRFVIRLVERDLIHKGQKKNCLEMAKALPTPYETVMIVYDDGKEKKKTVQYNAVPVKLPGHDNYLYLVVVKGFGQKPMMLLTSCNVNIHKKENVWRMVEYYLVRWKCDESYRYIKQSYNLEDIRVRSYTAIDIVAEKLYKWNKMEKNSKAEETERLKSTVMSHIEHGLGKDPAYSSVFDHYLGLSYALRDKLMERWVKTQRSYYKRDVKRVYYLSLEFLIGRTLGNSMVNLGIEDECTKALEELGHKMEAIREAEWDAGLGNGGLGRLAACFLDSMATLGIPAYGYGIRYEYGIFYQRLKNGYQIESPDNWLRYGNPWEIGRPNHLFPIKFHGRVNQYIDSKGVLRNEWGDTEDVMAMACDTPIPGYKTDNVINMRLWVAKATRAFDLIFFNSGNYIQAVEEKEKTECISKVLYPADHIMEGRLLRLKQQYFFVSATFQDIIKRYKKEGASVDDFDKKVAVQLNDTHPAIAIPELMRILVDIEGLSWEKAWVISVGTFAYTNHTVMPEALEKWPVAMFESLLPRHLQIIFEINRRFLIDVGRRFPGDFDKIRNMSLIEEGREKMIRMANLAIVGSHSINGVAAIHTGILKDRLFRDFYEMYPERFNNKTNGITPRRWLKKANPPLSGLITGEIGDRWVTDLDELRKIIPLAEDREFRERWIEVKRENKKKLAAYILSKNNMLVDADSMFDVQIKRIHEYKRQLLNILHVITLYNRIICGKGEDIAPRTVIFSGKAAPAYWMAKLIIKFIHSVADAVNNSREVKDRLKVVFLSNYNVSLAEKIIPAADLSEQISTAGTEASGTGNMKLSLNGALTIGTLDGANVEIMEEVGKDNIFIFGYTVDEILNIRSSDYNPYHYYDNNPELKAVIDMIQSGYFSPENRDLFKPIVDSLLHHDTYMLLADYESYINCQGEVGKLYKDKDKWAKISILNVAKMGKFSSDRTIMEYARDIWGIEPNKGPET